MRRLVLVLGGALALALVLPQVPPSQAQQRWEPPDPMNLQVLPKDIDKRELVQTMRSFTQALGVRCEHCHVGEEGQPLDTFNFMSDAKPTKATARKMIKMLADINDRYLNDVERHHHAGAHAESEPHDAPTEQETEGGPRVTCFTCHRGETHPATRGPRRQEP